jgi:energy-coupling factor transport system substrate-specific component
MSRARPGDTGGDAVPIGRRSGIVLLLASLGGALMFGWPLLLPAGASGAQHAADAPFAFVLILPVLVALVFAQLAEGGLDAKAVALLGVLSAVGAALRPLGAGANGIETVFFLLILAGRVFGPGFGFTLGCTSLFASALITAGVGPWLPFQMMASAWVGMGAGLLPGRWRGRAEIGLLAAYGAVAAYAFGALMNLWFWPFIAGASAGGTSGLAYDAGASVFENLRHFGAFTLLSSTATWDTGRAVTDVLLIVVLGPAVLGALRRAARRARFEPAVEFRPL